jgi:hypothetical protein
MARVVRLIERMLTAASPDARTGDRDASRGFLVVVW